MIGWTDSTTALGSGASFPGVARAVLNNGPYNFFAATSYADQIGTLSVQQSLDGGATWQNAAAPVATTANAPASIKVTMTGSTAGASSTSAIVPAQYRVNYTNGGTGQTLFRLSSAMTEV